MGMCKWRVGVATFQWFGQSVQLGLGMLVAGKMFF